MKNKTVAVARRRILASVALACLLGAGQARALDVIDPTGAIYTSVSNSSQFAAAWGATNLFTQDMSAISVGQTFGGAEWAKSGSGSAYVSFEVDQVYSVGSVYWAQRNGANTGDNMQRMSIWSSETTPFTTVNPGTPPDNVIALQPNTGASVWREYLLTNIMSGRYFLMYLEQTPGNITGNPGGNEMRLGLNPPPTPPSVLQPPQSKTIYAGGSVFFDVTIAGSVPATYQWYKDGVALQNGGRFSGATSSGIVPSSRLTVSQLTAGDQGNYYVAITNAYGGIESDPGVLTLTAAPNSGYPAAVMTNSPLGYWRLDEATGPTAFDYAGGYNGTYGVASILGASGPRPPEQTGFAADNAAVQTTAFVVDSAVALPPLNITSTNLTLTAWVKPDGQQNPYAGIVFSRSAGTISGLSYNSNGTRLAYQWAGNRVDFPSGMALPIGEWSMVALVVTPTNATLYCGTNQSIRVAVDNFTQPTFSPTLQSFGGTTMIGLDVSGGESARTFSGTIDDVAIYDRSLSEAEITALFTAGVGTLVPLPAEILSQSTDQSLFTGEPLRLAVTTAGTPPLNYQWYKGDTSIPGATNATFQIPGVRSTDSGGYYVIVTNQANSVTSEVAQVTVSTDILRVLDPKGTIYTNAVASSVFAANWGPTNLFKTDVTSIQLGTSIGSQAEYAKSGPGDAWVTFEVDQVYPIGAVYWAQRAGSGTGDNMQVMSLWTSDTTAFSTNDPGTLPDVVVPLNPGNLIWTRYLLTNQISGRYFLMHLERVPAGSGGNPGGAEMRLGVIGTPTPLTWSVVNSNLTLSWPTYGILQQASNIAGPWVDATGITNGAPIPTGEDKKFYRIKYY